MISSIICTRSVQDIHILTLFPTPNTSFDCFCGSFVRSYHCLFQKLLLSLSPSEDINDMGMGIPMQMWLMRCWHFWRNWALNGDGGSSACEHVEFYTCRIKCNPSVDIWITQVCVNQPSLLMTNACLMCSELSLAWLVWPMFWFSCFLSYLGVKCLFSFNNLVPI